MNIEDDIVCRFVKDRRLLMSMTCKYYYKLFQSKELSITLKPSFLHYEQYATRRLNSLTHVNLVGSDHDLDINWRMMILLSKLIKNGWNGLRKLEIILQPDKNSSESFWHKHNLKSVLNCSSITELNLSGFRNIGISDIGNIFHNNTSLTKLRLDSKLDIYLKYNNYNMLHGYYDTFVSPYIWLPIYEKIDCKNLRFLDISNRFLGISCNMKGVIKNVSRLKNLTHLNISNNYVEQSDLVSIYCLLDKCDKLVSLDMRYNYFDNITILSDKLTNLRFLGISQSRKDSVAIYSLDRFMKDMITFYVGETNNVDVIFRLNMVENLELDIDIVFLLRFQHLDTDNTLQHLSFLQCNVDMWVLNYEIFNVFENFLIYVNNLPQIRRVVLVSDHFGDTEDIIRNILSNCRTKFLHINPIYDLYDQEKILTEYIDEPANN